MLKKDNLPRVLVGCPINIVKDYCMDEWLEMVKNLSYSNYDVYLVDNTKNPEYHKGLRKKHNLKIDWVDPAKKEARVYMAECNEKIRKRAVKKNYDYLFILEVDIFPPQDIIQMLMVHGKQVVGATYFTDQGDETKLQIQIIRRVAKEKYVSDYITNSQARKFFNGTLQQAYANGNGCILIDAEVLKKLKFRVNLDEMGYADSFFHQDLFLIGIKNWVDTSIMPLHWNGRWSTIPDAANHELLFANLNK